MVRTVSIAAWLALLSIPAVAAADRVAGPPESCPPGSTPRSSHAGPHCAPTPDCARDAECPGSACTAVEQCIQARPCGGRRPPPRPGEPPCTVDHVIGSCGPGRACDGAQCRSRRVCGAAGTAAGPAPVPPAPTPVVEPPAPPPPHNTIHQGPQHAQPMGPATASEGESGCSVGGGRGWQTALPIVGIALGVGVVVAGRRRSAGKKRET